MGLDLDSTGDFGKLRLRCSANSIRVQQIYSDNVLLRLVSFREPHERLEQPRDRLAPRQVGCSIYVSR
jgi:hypothetical protein